MNKNMLRKTAAAGIAAMLMAGGLSTAGQGPAAGVPDVYAEAAPLKKGRRHRYSGRLPCTIRP